MLVLFIQIVFCVVLTSLVSQTQPALPPRVSTSVTGIAHPNLFGSYICCDLLKNQDQIYAEKGYTGGYTPALTLRGLFLQFLTFFSSTSVRRLHNFYLDFRLTGYLYSGRTGWWRSSPPRRPHTDDILRRLFQSFNHQTPLRVPKESR